jgi:hypothetical protein
MKGRLEKFSTASAARLIAQAALVVATSLPAAALAQEQVLPAQPAPPPMRWVPDAARAQLAAAPDAKARVKVTLAMLEERLARAEQLTAAGRFDPAAAELGIYQALAEDVIEYLRPVGRTADGARVDGPTRDRYKQLELTLNKHTARIEALRRVTPQDAQRNVRDAFLRVRDLRTEALNAFFGNTVLREPVGRTGDANATPPAPKTDASKPPAN